MRTKSLLIIFTSVVFSAFTSMAQTLLISENFSSPEWQAELARLNPGTEFNPNATNPIAYSTPIVAASSYTGLNSTDLYFGKYRLSGAIEAVAVLPCAAGDEYSHDHEGIVDVAFRLQNSAAGCIELPELSNVGTVTIHIRNGNGGNATQVGLEKYNSADETWANIHTFDLQGWQSYPDFRDEVLSFEVNSDEPIKLRLINNVATQKRFMNLFQIDVTPKVTSNVETAKPNSLKVVGRTITTNQPELIRIYNVMGSVVFEKNVDGSIELPVAIEKGVYLVKAGSLTQKILLD